jgi:peptidoglycan/xylan/chitin deacetylase (PgdA/CDA1 family)
MTDVSFAYHDVGRRTAGDRFTVDVALFGRHADAMRDAPTRVTPTFDDGFKSAIEIVAPALEERSLTGVFFVITNQIGKPDYLTLDDIRELVARGHEVGSHTHSHRRAPYLKDLSDDQVREEWRRSKAILEDTLGTEVTAASVPYGFYTPRVGDLAALEGYRTLYISRPCTEPERRGELTVRGRFGVIADTPPDRIAALCRLDRRAIRREQAVWHARRTAQRALGPAYVRLRRALLGFRHA